MKTWSKWNQMALPAALVITLVAAPAIAGVSWGYNRGQCLVGATSSGNSSYKYGTREGTNKVLRFDSNNDSYPEMVLMFARGSVKNKSRVTQRFSNLGTTIKDEFGYYQAQTDIVTVLGFRFTTYGYNITLATWRNQGLQEPTEEL